MREDHKLFGLVRSELLGSYVALEQRLEMEHEMIKDMVVIHRCKSRV